VKATFIKCDYCKAGISNKTEQCVFAIHKQIINGKEYHFCCEAHADRFKKEKKKKKK
jgi:YHS domain-containing protein